MHSDLSVSSGIQVIYICFHPCADGTLSAVGLDSASVELDPSLEEGSISIGLKDVLIFFTGADRVPPLGFISQPTLTFLHDPKDIFPTASTCSLELRLPTTHAEYNTFKDYMIIAFKGHGGFGVV